MARRQTVNMVQQIGTTGTSATTSITTGTTGNSQEFYEFNRADRAVLYLEVSAASGSNPSLTVKLQERNPATGNWVDVPNGAFAAQTGVTSGVPVRLTIDPVFAQCCRASWTISGSTPSFTFSCVAVLSCLDG